MNISGIRPTASIYEYKIVKENSEITAQQAETPQAKENENVFVEQNVQTETAFSYVRKHEPDKKYELKGSESSLEDLDVEQAISDRKKEQLLQQYQFFVGTSRQGKETVEDSLIRPYENFDI